MNDFKWFLAAVIGLTLVAGLAVWAQVKRFQVGYEIERLEQEQIKRKDERRKLLEKVNHQCSPWAMRRQMEKFKLDLVEPTGASFVDPRCSSPLLECPQVNQ